MKFIFPEETCIPFESGTTFLGSSLASGPQDGLGQGGLRLKWAKGGFGSKNDEKVKVLKMEFSIVEHLSGLQESIFSLSRGPNSIWVKKQKFSEWACL